MNDSASPNSGDRTSAAIINLITVLIVLIVVALVVWFLVVGMGAPRGNMIINLPPPPAQIPIPTVKPP